ncbi:MAG: hypothetical protein MUC99_10695, partial [Anaerolineae bacterium]|nr:hypothetical protein [Anaerolineae bacterium]
MTDLMQEVAEPVLALPPAGDPVREAIVRVAVLCVALLIIYLARRLLSKLLLPRLQRLTIRNNKVFDDRLIEAVFGSV